MSNDFFEIQPLNENQQNLNGKFSHSWVEENFHLEKQTDRHQSNSGTRKYMGKSISNKHLLWFGIFLIFGLAIIFLKSFYTQVIRGNYFFTLAENNRVRLRPIPAERGIIFDRFGTQLVQNIPDFSLSIIPQDLPLDQNKRQEIIARLSDISGLTTDYIKNLLQKYKNYSYDSLVLKENLDYDTSLKIYIESAQMPGVLISGGNKRFYIYSQDDNSPSSTVSLSHVMGYLSKLNDDELEEKRSQGYLLSDNIGKTGVEKTYETELRGIYGRKKIEVNAAGQEQNVVAEEPPTPGKNLYLTID
ncbi:MAG: hypothetical protein HY979_01570, partial [Candidatus Magasanikbacteria bacterium]|nr:hypothetical protein [Candidatus Magasanikbacteria bacterium]